MRITYLALFVSLDIICYVQGRSRDGEGRSLDWSTLASLSEGKSMREERRSSDFELDDQGQGLGIEDDMNPSESQNADVYYSDIDAGAELRVNPYRKRLNRYRRRKKYSNSNNVPSQDFYSTGSNGDYKNEEDVERDSSYSAPSSGSSYEAPTSYDSPPSYTGPSYEASSYEDTYAPTYSGGKDNNFNDFLNALAAFLPIGLFLAAIPPNLIVINSRRKRSTDDNDVEDELVHKVTSTGYNFPFLSMIREMGGVEQLTRKPECQKELFCTMTSRGKNKDANGVQKFMRYAVEMTPNFMSNMIGVQDILKDSMAGECQKYKCRKH